MMSLTVAICTNRYDALLEKCIRTVSAQCKGNACVLLVANGDEAVAQRVGSFVQGLPEDRRPAIRLVFEPTLGLSQARNRALQECRTRYIAFIDDDAYPAPDWSEQLLDAFERYDASCVGGPVHLIWSAPQPRWVTTRLRAYFTHVDWGESDIHLTGRPELWLAGTNIAFDADILCASGGFPVALGRVGGSLLSGEETYMQALLRRQNLPIWYCAKALVFHQVRPERVSRRWMLARAYWGGVSDQLIHQLQGSSEQFMPLLKGVIKETLRLGLLRCSLIEWLSHMAYILGKLRDRRVGYMSRLT